ncbi:hypothetical protein COV19_02690 [Candidatus Woesearchaeota archaeon CG10_big_fil_rev_8_21_14_0_10_44_13]|nr:MAG: hypothetical protein COV19_02690 [Candidatus Woesearchaeota archaeon CG10_big_fil_rev_8_21_14_0_10_44_13]
MVVLFDQYNLPENVYEVVFATEQQAVVGKLLIDELKSHGGEMGKTEMSLFANNLHEGTIIEVDEPGPMGRITRKKLKISYNKRQFYDRILTPMKAMGMIDYDLYQKRYKISDKFNRALTKIGIMWSQEVHKKPRI